MNIKIRIISLIIAISFSFKLYAQEENLLLEIKKRKANPGEALKYVYSDSKRWNLLLKNIENGTHEWLNIWPMLKKASDSGASEELNISMSKVLKNNSLEVITMIEKNWNLEKDRRTAFSSICSSVTNEVQDMENVPLNKEIELAFEILTKSKNNLLKIRSKANKKMVDLCLQKLHENEEFWEKKKNELK